MAAIPDPLRSMEKAQLHVALDITANTEKYILPGSVGPLQAFPGGGKSISIIVAISKKGFGFKMTRG